MQSRTIWAGVNPQENQRSFRSPPRMLDTVNLIHQVNINVPSARYPFKHVIYFTGGKKTKTKAE